MSKFQLPPLKDEKCFEELVCDLFNAIENTNTYRNTDFQLIGVKGQAQQGIDIFSTGTKTVIQCKLKDIRKKDDTIRKNLQEDIQNDLIKVQSLEIPISRFIIASTYRDDNIIQSFIAQLQEDNELKFNLYYWGWDTISRYAEDYDYILKKHFSTLIYNTKTSKPKQDFPEGALGRDLLRKNYVSYLIKRYGDWKQLELNRNGEKFNWASFNKHLMNKFKAPGINYIHIGHFDNLVCYLKDRIDKTIQGKSRKFHGNRNYSEFKEHTQGIIE